MSVPASQEEITAEWFQAILGEVGEEVTVNDVNIQFGTNPGENLAVEVLRATLTGSKDGASWSQSYMMKIMPMEKWRRDDLLEMKIFDQEVEAYVKILPDMVSVQEGHDKLSLDTPKCVFAKMDGGNGLIVMEDLKPQGYTLGDLRKGLDFDHCKLVMQNLAKFHALGYKCKYSIKEPLIQKYPGLRDVPFTSDVFKGMREDGFNIAKTILTNKSGMEKQLKIFEEKAEAALVKGSCNNASEPLSTICHGDSWGNNTMFKYGKDGTPISNKLVDFQMMHYGLPTRDLGYFFCCSTTGELRKNHLKELMQYYHRELLQYLGRLGVTQITEKEFSFETLWQLYYRETVQTGFMISISAMGEVLLEPEDLIRPSDFKGDSAQECLKLYQQQIKDKILQHPNVQNRIIDIVNEMIAEGVLH